MRKPAPKTFELGLVMAGAVSAGAYTAGVLDFLFEALDAWEQARRESPDGTPDHRVKIRVITGTSAGGIAAGLAAMLPFTGHHPIREMGAARRRGCLRSSRSFSLLSSAGRTLQFAIANSCS